MKTEHELIYCGKATPYAAAQFLKSKNLSPDIMICEPAGGVFDDPNGKTAYHKITHMLAEFANQSDKEKLIDFFLWLRQNGELHIDKSVEGMIGTYLNERA